MRKSFLMISAAALAAFASAQYKAESAGPPPSDLAPAILSDLNEKGHKVLGPDGKVLCELWFRKAAPKGPVTTESDVSWKTMPHGELIGAIRWPEAGSDRRGQNLKPGVYTLRFSFHPINGDHQGVAPQRDFLVMTPAGLDPKPDAVPKFDDLMNMSRKASGTPHPAVLAMYVVEGDFKPGMVQQGEHDWALNVVVGEAKIALTLVGRSE
jgi:hypothetical protein